MSEIGIKRWNYMEDLEKKGEDQIKNLRDQEKALEAERVLLQNAEKTDQEKALEAERVRLQEAEKTLNFKNRYHQFIKHNI
jgi:hypothetical protein